MGLKESEMQFGGGRCGETGGEIVKSERCFELKKALRFP